MQAFMDLGSQQVFIYPNLVEKPGLTILATLLLQILEFGVETTSEMLHLVRVQGKLSHKKTVNVLAYDRASTKITCKGIRNVVEALRDKGIAFADKRIQSDTLKEVKLLIDIHIFSQFSLGQRRYLGINVFLSSAGVILFAPLPK